MRKKATKNEGTAEKVPGIGDDDHPQRQLPGLQKSDRLRCIFKSRGGQLLPEDFFRIPAGLQSQAARHPGLTQRTSSSGEKQIDIRMFLREGHSGFYPTTQSRGGAAIGLGRATRHDDR